KGMARHGSTSIVADHAGMTPMSHGDSPERRIVAQTPTSCEPWHGIMWRNSGDLLRGSGNKRRRRRHTHTRAERSRSALAGEPHRPTEPAKNRNPLTESGREPQLHEPGQEPQPHKPGQEPQPHKPSREPQPYNPAKSRSPRTRPGAAALQTS